MPIDFETLTALFRQREALLSELLTTNAQIASHQSNVKRLEEMAGFTAKKIAAAEAKIAKIMQAVL